MIYLSYCKVCFLNSKPSPQIQLRMFKEECFKFGKMGGVTIRSWLMFKTELVSTVKFIKEIKAVSLVTMFQ